jgi:hypothetical protein
LGLGILAALKNRVFGFLLIRFYPRESAANFFPFGCEGAGT